MKMRLIDALIVTGGNTVEIVKIQHKPTEQLWGVPNMVESEPVEIRQEDVYEYGPKGSKRETGEMTVISIAATGTGRIRITYTDEID